MKKIIFSSLIGLALVAFTGCTNSDNADFANLILVGIWLAVKENGETL